MSGLAGKAKLLEKVLCVAVHEYFESNVNDVGGQLKRYATPSKCHPTSYSPSVIRLPPSSHILCRHHLHVGAFKGILRAANGYFQDSGLE